MSRKVNCQYNSVIENFFEIVKREFSIVEKFEIEKDIEYYNNDRVSLNIKKTPN